MGSSRGRNDADCVAYFLWKILQQNRVALCDDRTAVDNIFKFADVAGPSVAIEHGQRLGGYLVDPRFFLFEKVLHTKIHDLRNVVDAIPQRWHSNPHDV